MNADLVYCQCKTWQDWINNQDIQLGQPMLKEDKKSRLHCLEERVHYKSIAQPAVWKANMAHGTKPVERRYYLPRSLDQLLQFLFEQTIVTQIVYGDTFDIITVKASVKNCSNWYDAGAKLLIALEMK